LEGNEVVGKEEGLEGKEEVGNEVLVSSIIFLPALGDCDEG
jgi:hypothetical protein